MPSGSGRSSGTSATTSRSWGTSSAGWPSRCPTGCARAVAATEEIPEPEGREHIASRHHAPPWNTEEDTHAMGDMKQQLKQIHIAAAQVIRAGDEEQVRRAAQALAEARRTMYRILADDDEA